MKVHVIHDSTDNDALEILKTGLAGLESTNLLDNYSPSRKDQNSNLFFLLESGRYQKGHGAYYVLEDRGKYVASSGWNQYNDRTALLLTRAYIVPEYRNQFPMSQYLLRDQITASCNYLRQWITFNTANKAMYDWFGRYNRDPHTPITAMWPTIYREFQPIGFHNIYHTSQYIVQLKK